VDLAIFSLRMAASFRNQAQLLYKAGVHYGLGVVEKDMGERVLFPKEHWDRVIILCPLWPRYIWEAVRLSSPWITKDFNLYGPVDGPYIMNIGFFNVINNLRVIATSQACREWMISSGVHVDKVVPHGIDPNDFLFDNSGKYDRLKVLREQHPGKTIFFSNINPLSRKGLDRLAEALQILEKKRPDSFIFILHTGRKKALELFPVLDKVKGLIIEDAYNTLPFRQVVLKTLSCDVYVNPSKLEGFGLTVLEAMACRRTIISTDAAAHNEMISSKEAWMVPIREVKQERWEGPGCIAQIHEYEAESLAMAMMDAMDHPQESLEKAENAYKRSQDYHYLKVYKDLVGGH